MHKFETGQLVRVLRAGPTHNYTVGERYTIAAIDKSDSTLRLSGGPDKGPPRGWLPFADAAPVGVGWEYCKGALPEEIVTLLSACRGVQSLALKSDVRDELIRSLPDLRERLVEAVRAANG